VGRSACRRCMPGAAAREHEWSIAQGAIRSSLGTLTFDSHGSVVTASVVPLTRKRRVDSPPQSLAAGTRIVKHLRHTAEHLHAHRMESAMSATLRMTREGAGIELRRGRFEIVADGQSVGSLERHETVETLLEPGHHTLRVRAGRYSSHDHSFDVADGETVYFRCHGTMIWPRYVASIVKPDLAIALKQE
jgi:hypothetical protein